MAEPREIYMSRKNGWLPRAVATLVVGGLVVVALLASVAYVPAGHGGGVTLFGRGTGPGLPEGTHLIFPFKTVNRMAIRTVELKEAASGPSQEGVICSPRTSLL